MEKQSNLVGVFSTQVFLDVATDYDRHVGCVVNRSKLLCKFLFAVKIRKWKYVSKHFRKDLFSINKLNISDYSNHTSLETEPSSKASGGDHPYRPGYETQVYTMTYEQQQMVLILSTNYAVQ